MPTITFNNASGSDAAASGAGPATALSGTGASYSGSVFTLDGSPDMSGVEADGTHVIWVQTSTGRQFFTINNVVADTVTVDDAPAGTATGLAWGLGGKRKTLDNTQSRLLFTADMKPGWRVELEDNQTLTSTLTFSVSGGDGADVKMMLASDTPGTLRTVTGTTSAAVISLTANNVGVEWLKIQNSGATKTSAHGISVANVSGLAIKHCVIGDAANTLQTGILRTSSSPHPYIYDCEIAHCINDGVNIDGSQQTLHIFWCYIHDNGGAGIRRDDGASMTVMGCVITDNTGNGIFADGQFAQIIGNTIDGNGGDGINLTYQSVLSNCAIINNIITNNGGYGIECHTSTVAGAGQIIDWNNFGLTGSGAGTNNTSGATLPSGLDAGSVTSANVTFGDAANDDWSVGTGQKAIGYPDVNIGAGQSASRSYVDLGAVQRQESAGGGGREPAYLRSRNTLLRM